MSQTENVVKLVYALQRRYGNILEQIDENIFIKVHKRKNGESKDPSFELLTPLLSLTSLTFMNKIQFPSLIKNGHTF